MDEVLVIGAVLVVAVVAGGVAIALGIFVLAPRLTRMLDRSDRPDRRGLVHEELNDRAD
jgi:hypothetical protein